VSLFIAKSDVSPLIEYSKSFINFFLDQARNFCMKDMDFMSRQRCNSLALFSNAKKDNFSAFLSKVSLGKMSIIRVAKTRHYI